MSLFSRCDALEFLPGGAPTFAATGASLFFGCVMTSDAGAASLSINNINTTNGGVENDNRKFLLQSSSATGTESIFPPVPVVMSNGLFATGGGFRSATILYSQRS